MYSLNSTHYWLLLVGISFFALWIWMWWTQQQQQTESFAPVPASMQTGSMTSCVSPPTNGSNYAGLTNQPPVVSTITNPMDLLPQAPTAQQAMNNPIVLPYKNFLEAGHMIGKVTVQTSMKNPNVGLRADPLIKKVDTPWNASTIEPDLYRQPLCIS